MPDEGFERTLLPHLDSAYNVARWILHDDSLAQEVVQESFMRTLRYYHTLRGQDALPWLLQIVRNTAYTFLERRRRELSVEHLSEDAPVPDESAHDPSAAISEKIDVEALLAAVDNLPHEFREVIVLRELEGLSYKQIADSTGVSLGTVMSRLSRARRRLQVVLAPESQKELDHGM